MDRSKPIILFDGVCNLCNRSVQFVLKRDTARVFRYASLQSGAGQKILQEFNIPQDHFNSFVLFDEGKVYTRSDAALRVAAQLKGWKWTKMLRIVPRFVRDAVYNTVARNRYRWFGKREQCMLPRPEYRERFIG